MMKSLFLGLSALAVSTVSAFNWEVDVGKGGNLTFNPPTILGAVPGDTVTYNFFAKVRTNLLQLARKFTDLYLRITLSFNLRSKTHVTL
jgi:hypothetical protein